MAGIDAIQHYRLRQIDQGYTSEHDQEHNSSGELIDAAMCHLCAAMGWVLESDWPWPEVPRPEHGERERLVNLAKAGAYIAAEYDRQVMKDN